MLLTTAFFLDFGAGFAAGGINTTVGSFRNIDGTGANGFGTGSDLTLVGMNSADDLTFTRLSYDYDGNSIIDVNDTNALQNAVLPIVQRALAAFDIDVVLAAATTFNDVVTSLQANDSGSPGFDGFGENDAYNFVTTLTSSVFPGFGGSVGINAGLFGIAAAEDLFTGTTNNTDEATLTFADNVFNATTGTAGSDEFNENLAYRLAYTAVHEGLHTFNLLHTRGSTADEQLLTRGDAIRSGSDTRETDNIVTRFDLQLNGSTTLVNNYETLRDDPDIGLVDRDHNSVPDFAYVTGTGGYDEIVLTSGGVGVTNVTVNAYREAARTNLIRSESYTITQGVDTDGSIVIDSSINDDYVNVSSAVTVGVVIRGGDGDDVLIAGSGNDVVRGEDGNDAIYGRSGNDRLFGNDGNDVIYAGSGNDIVVGGSGNDFGHGGSGNDRMYGNDGDDRLYGSLGHDRMFGGNGNDFMHGGSGNDVMSGGSGNDRMYGSRGHDRMSGTDGDDFMHGGSGNDVMSGGSGNDRMYGSLGNDRMFGGNGNDFMNGGSGNDVMSGGSGNDRMYGSRGHDRMFANDGDDFMHGGSGNDVMDGGLGNDRMFGGTGNDRMFGRDGDDFMNGGPGNDLLVGGPGIDAVFGGGGIDLILP